LLVISLALLVTQASADAVVGKASSSAVRERVLDLVNQARGSSRRCGDDRFSATTPLTPSSVLNRAARDHARDMARNNYFEHIGRDGSTPKERLARLNYRSSLTGENIAFGPESAEEVVSGWLASPGHCANIMEPHYLEMGIAVASGKKRGAIYWVQDFAAPHR
jgi:uncharacterized protein YkwD